MRDKTPHLSRNEYASARVGEQTSGFLLNSTPLHRCLMKHWEDSEVIGILPASPVMAAALAEPVTSTADPTFREEACDERAASLSLPGTHPYIRPPPPPHQLCSPITPETSLFQTIHFAPAPTVDLDAYRLVVTGLVQNPITLNLNDIKALPSTTVIAFQECYGPPTLPADTNRWRVGCVRWTGVRLSHLLSLAKPTASARFVWTDGLDKGTFQGVFSDRFRKDLPMSKALAPEVLVAYEINGEPLSQNRGGPVRLVVPGWFGTNSTKWLCRLEVSERRAEGEFVGKGRFYNEEVPDAELEGTRGETKWDGDVLWENAEGKGMRPVWRIQVNSMIVRPRPDEIFVLGNGLGEVELEVEGRAWSDTGVEGVEVSLDDGGSWEKAEVEERPDYGWQKFRKKVKVGKGEWKVIARAECKSGMKQPLEGRRNHVHSASFRVE